MNFWSMVYSLSSQYCFCGDRVHRRIFEGRNNFRFLLVQWTRVSTETVASGLVLASRCGVADPTLPRFGTDPCPLGCRFAIRNSHFFKPEAQFSTTVIGVRFVCSTVE